MSLWSEFYVYIKLYIYLRRSDLTGHSQIRIKPFLLYVYRDVSLDMEEFLENCLC